MTNKDKTKEEKSKCKCIGMCACPQNKPIAQYPTKDEAYSNLGTTNKLPSDFTIKKMEEFDKLFVEKKYARFGGYYKAINNKKGKVEEIKSFFSQSILQAQEAQKEQTSKEILNALRYVVAEDEDGWDTLEEIIKVAGIDK